MTSFVTSNIYFFIMQKVANLNLTIRLTFSSVDTMAPLSNRIPTGSCVNPLFHIWRWPSRGFSDQELHSKSFIAEELILSGENSLTLGFNRHEGKTIHRSNLEMSIGLVNWRLSAMKMSCFGSNTVWFCHVLLLDESEHPVEIRVSEQTFWVDP